MTNNEFLKYLEARIKQEKRKDLKKKLKENYMWMMQEKLVIKFKEVK